MGGIPQIQAGKTQQRENRTANEFFRRQMKQTEQQHQHIQHQKRAAGGVQMRQQKSLPAEAHQHLKFGQAGVFEALVVFAEEHQAQGALRQQHEGCGQPQAEEIRIVIARAVGHPDQHDQQYIGAGCQGKAFEPQPLDRSVYMRLVHHRVKVVLSGVMDLRRTAGRSCLP